MQQKYCKENDGTIFSLRDALETDVSDDLNALQAQKGTRTNNGRHFDAWDLIYENISTTAVEMGLLPVIISRGALWNAVGALNQENGNLFLFMKNDNPEQRIKDDNHYLPLLTQCFNSDFNDAPGSSIPLFDTFDEFDEERVKKMLGEDVFKQVKKVFVIRFNSSELISSLLTYNGLCDLIDEEIIPENIQPTTPAKQSIPSQEIGQEEKPSIKLKEKIKKIS